MHSSNTFTIKEFQTHLQIEVENHGQDFSLGFNVNYVKGKSFKKTQNKLKVHNKGSMFAFIVERKDVLLKNVGTKIN